MPITVIGQVVAWVVPRYILFLVAVLMLAAVGVELGFRRHYIRLLTRFFEFACRKIERAELKKRSRDESMCESEVPSTPLPPVDGDKLVTKVSDTQITSTTAEKEQTDEEIVDELMALDTEEDSEPEPNDCDEEIETEYPTSQDEDQEADHPDSGLGENGDDRSNKPDRKNSRMERSKPSRQSLSKQKSLIEEKYLTNLAAAERKPFDLSDIMGFVKSGIQAIVDDEVTKRFDTEELRSWNGLTRTNKNYQALSWRLSVLWSIGFFFRYCVLMPSRVVITVMGVHWLIFCTALVGCIPDGPLKRHVYNKVSLMCFRILSRGFSGVITYHNTQYKAKNGGICVANHTSPIDVVVLACDNSYALVGQRHSGFLGVLQRALARATSHIWFERFEMTDRELVSKRMKQHAEDPTKLPILIFPEGTCINNSAVMQFKKGSFEVVKTIYPVAIKYDQRFGDPFWNSSKQGYMYYLLLMMTSWAIVCDVWYLPPMTREENESSIDFASRVKGEIARQGGLVDLSWDGQLKRVKPKDEWKAKQQEEFSKRIKFE